MVESLFSALEFLRGADDLLISYGDIIYEPNNLRAVLACQDEMGIMVDTHWKGYWTLRFLIP